MPGRGHMTSPVKLPSGFKAAAITALLFLLTSCSYTATFTGPSGERPVYGDYWPLARKLWVTLPSGESFEGNAFSLGYGELDARAGSLFQRIEVSTFLETTGPREEWIDRRAILKGDRGTTMEVLFRCNGPRDAGYGGARTDKGEEYLVEFSLLKRPFTHPGPRKGWPPPSPL